MRALLKQTISRLQADYVVLHNGEALYKIRVQFSVYPLYIEICDNKGPLYTVKSTIVGDAPVTEQQVAMIHKGTKVRGNLDEYELYALDQKGMLAAVIYAAYLDVLKHRNIGELSKHKVQVKYTVSLSKKTRALLDKSFMDRC